MEFHTIILQCNEESLINKTCNRRLAKIESQLTLKYKGKKIAKVLYVSGQENFDITSIDADTVLSRPYNNRCLLPNGLSYPEAFKDGPVITWYILKNRTEMA